MDTDTTNHLLVNKMVLRALERMDLMGLAPVSSISHGLTNTGNTSDREKAEIFLDLLTLTDVDNIDLETGQLKDGVELLTDTGRKYNNPQTINQLYERSGFTGRGRTDQEAEELGLTSDYDASPGDVFQNEVDNDYQLAKRLMDGDEGGTDTMVAGLGIPGATQATDITTTPFQRYNAALEQEDQVTNLPQDQNWQRGTGMGRGIQDVLGVLTDSSGSFAENPFGRTFAAMVDGPNAHVKHSLTGRDEDRHGDSTPYTFFNDMIDRESPVYQNSRSQVLLDGLADKPSTPMPDEHSGSWMDRQRHISNVNDASENSQADEYRDQYRSKYGEYPSKAKEFAVGVGEELFDYGMPISFVTGALMSSPGILSRAVGGAAHMAKEFLTEDATIGTGLMGAAEVANPNTPRTLEGWTSSERLDLPRQTDEEHQSDLLDARKKRDASSAFAKKYAEGLGS